MKPKVYLETSVVSYLTARPSRSIVAAGHQLVTLEWWQKERKLYDLLISDLVILEASAGNVQMAKKRLEFLNFLPLLEAGSEARDLTKKIIGSKVMPEKAASDASHIAIATVHGLDYLLTWNCKHIANAKIFPKIFEIIRAEGYKPPILCTPEELLGDSKS